MLPLTIGYVGLTCSGVWPHALGAGYRLSGAR